jgi:subtilisin family serine protease
MRRQLKVILISALLIIAVVVSFQYVFPSSSISVGSPSSSLPQMNVSPSVDKDGNKIEDSFDVQVQSKIADGNGSELAKVIVLLDVAPSVAHTSILSKYNGTLTSEPWSQALYGFGATIPYASIAGFVQECPNLLLVQADHEYTDLMAYAARQVGARTYAWNVLGYSGDPQSSIAIVDTGIDYTHPMFGTYGDADFSKKIVGWTDYINSRTTPYDDNGHGSHVAGISTGTGFYTTDSSGRAVATWSASFALSQTGTYIVTGFNVTNTGTGTNGIEADIKWADNGGTPGAVLAMYLVYAGSSANTDDWTTVGTVQTPTKNATYTINYDVTDGNTGYYHVELGIQSGSSSNGHVLVTIHWPYTPPSDSYSAWTGVAFNAKLVGVKGIDASGSGTSTNLVNAINWVVTNKLKYHILVLSMSWGGGSYDSAIDFAVSNAERAGIVCVAAAGNGGSGGNNIHSPGSNAYAITVGATTITDNVTSYSSQGGASEANSTVTKPDILAPGGSFYYLPIYSADSNSQDANGYFSDYFANDAAPLQGTSMSAPSVAGCADIVAQALGGYSAWSYSLSQALKVKTLLLMTATETYPLLREKGTSSTSPTLDRGSKDIHEGYGRVNLDAAVEAASLTYRTGDVATDTFGSSPLDRMCWARNVYLYKGTAYQFNLAVPSSADYDLYLYNMTGNSNGEPVIVAKSTTTTAGASETISYTPTLSGSYYIVVKKATESTGTGQFSLTSSPSPLNISLQLSVDQYQATYARGQSLDFTVNIFNRMNPALNSTLVLTITGPNGYYYLDSQTVNVPADSISAYSFTWVIPNVVGTYAIEVGLIPPTFTTYDTVWLGVT